MSDLTYAELVEKVVDGLWRDGIADRDVARNAIAIIAEALKEPTEAMVGVGTDVRWAFAVRDANSVREIFAAMLAASPLFKEGE